MVKIIIGLNYEGNQEITKSIQFLEQHSDNLSLGFELTERYEEHKRNFLGFPIIGDIADYFSGKGKIFFLEDESLVVEYRALEIALAVTEGRCERNKIEILKDQYSRFQPYHPPEEVYLQHLLFTRYEQALSFLNSGKDVKKLHEESIMERRAFMRDKIVEHNPQIVFVSSAHAKKLEEGLTGYVMKDVNFL